MAESDNTIEGEGKYGPFPEAGGPRDSLEFVKDAFAREARLISGSEDALLPFEGLHLPTVAGEMPESEIQELFTFIKPDWNMVRTGQGSWEYLIEPDPKAELINRIMPVTWGLVQTDLDRLNKHGIPVVANTMTIKRQIADKDGHFDANSEPWHIDGLNYLVSPRANGSDAYPTRFKLGSMRPLEPLGSGAYVVMDTSLAPSAGGEQDYRELSAPANAILRLPNFVTHASPTGPAGAERTLINVRTRLIKPKTLVPPRYSRFDPDHK